MFRSKKKLTINSLSEYQSSKGMNKVSTLHLNDIPIKKSTPVEKPNTPSSDATAQQAPSTSAAAAAAASSRQPAAKFTDSADDKFYDALCTPTAGSMNLVKSLKLQDKIPATKGELF